MTMLVGMSREGAAGLLSWFLSPSMSNMAMTSSLSLYCSINFTICRLILGNYAMSNMLGRLL